MPSALGIALTALIAFDRQLDVNANNIANEETNNFKKSRVEFQEAINGGVEVTISKVDTPGLELDSNARTGIAQQSSNVALEEEIANNIIAQYYYEAGVITIKTAAAMEKELLNIKA